MQDLVERFQNLTIRAKILLCFLVILFTSFTVIAVLYNLAFERSMTELANESAVVMINQANNSVESLMGSMERTIETLRRDDQVEAYLNAPSSGIEGTEVSLTRVSACNSLNFYREVYPQITGIAVISNDGSFISNEMYQLGNESFLSQDWYLRCLREPESYQLLIKPASRNLAYYQPISADEILCIAKAVVDSSQVPLGVILVDIQVSAIGGVLQGVEPGKEGFVFMMDSEETILYAPVNGVVPRVRKDWFQNERGILEKTILGERYQLIYQTSAKYGWTAVGVFSLSATLEQVASTRTILLLILCAAGTAAFILAFLFASSIVRPLTKLQSLMEKVEGGDPTVRFHSRYHDEIGKLGNAFNAMLDKMQSLIDQVYIEQKKKRYAELSVLQAQIKPHFLYNTFDTIHWMAKRYGADDIVYVVRCLTNLFRIGLSKGSEIIPIREECRHAENYLKIQQVRYDEILDYSMEIQPGIEDLYVQKLILQPVVENAIYHGIKAAGERGLIEIRGFREGDKVFFVIADDGVGMDAEQLRRLNDRFKNGTESSKEGYGLYNVDQRIRLTFGPDYGVHVDSTLGYGTVVTITCPVITRPKQTDHAKVPLEYLDQEGGKEC